MQHNHEYLTFLQSCIEDFRCRLNDLVVKKNYNLLDKDVLKVSQELDQLILKYLKVINKN